MSNVLNKIRKYSASIYSQKDKFWFIVWLGILGLTFIWNTLFLNKPALRLVIEGSLNTLYISVLVVIFSFILGWIIGLFVVRFESSQFQLPYFLLTFILNLLRSIPQIIGILLGYVGITYLITANILNNSWLIMTTMALAISLFIFNEVIDLIRERINHFKKLDFYNAMKVCGISENRIINFDILWKNSRIHILNKLIAIFGSAIFLQCTIDFIISVGLSTQVSSVSLPTTLGSLLAKIDSKQDILAIGNTIMNPSYFSHIFFEHLQGVTVAFLIVFTLLSVYKISNGFAERNRL
jgi:ABC-type dipeptide/oligopeptide/nickel transport system permease subunit